MIYPPRCVIILSLGMVRADQAGFAWGISRSTQTLALLFSSINAIAASATDEYAM